MKKQVCSVSQTPNLQYKRAFQVNLTLAVLVWIGWYALGGQTALQSLIDNWQITLTMIFGSMVAGATSEGGGAVAFPVFTKVLHIPPHDARVFCLAIQSVGMTAASIGIFFLRVPVEWRAVLWAGLAGVFGILFSTFYVMPFVSPPLVKISFTVMVSSLAIALVFMNRREKSHRHKAFPRVGRNEIAILMLTGFIGGMMSGLVGSGIDIITFMTMVLLFRLDEKVATPTTVLLMTSNTLVGFLTHLLVLDTFTPTVQGYWLAAVPVVVIGAPLGACICASLSRRVIANVLIGLIAIEFVSTLVIIPMSPKVMLTAGLSLAICGLINWAMCRADWYCPKKQSLSEPQLQAA
jgi:uncharacterized membrane protein YfcA